MSLTTHTVFGARNSFRFDDPSVVARRSGPKSALLAICLIATASLQAQQPTPHIGYVYPAGGRQGTIFQVVVGGQYLNGATNAFVSGQGVRATLVEYNRPLTQNQFNELRDELRALQEKRRASKSQNSTNVWTAADDKRFAELRSKILKNAPNRQGNPAIAETVTLQVTAAADAAPGERDIRIETGNGLSNPLVFCVGQLPEFAGLAAKAENPDLERFKRLLGEQPASAFAKSEMRVTVPIIVNGQIMPGELDRFRFTAHQDQHLVAFVSARQLIPYLPDAVPGWFQATLALYDAKGKELAYDDDFRFHPDPVIRFEIPRDGEYIIEIKDAIYRGREDFVYRIALGELPFVTSIFPLGGKAGAQSTIELKGWNLPTNTLTIQPKDCGSGVVPISVSKDARISNHVPFAVDTLPECLERESNNSPASAQELTRPMIVNGCIDQPGDWDVFRFEGGAGEQLVAEVYARRLDSPLDSVLKLTDATGKQLAFNDDHEDKASGLNTHHADSYLLAILPANGAYYIHLSDVQHKGGAEYAYRLRISAPRPDFELRVVPSSIRLRGGASVPLTVYALRKDGFTNEITLALTDAPESFKLSGARVPANQDQVRMTLTTPLTMLDEPASLSLQGHAMIQGKAVIRSAVPAEDMMQAFAYRHLVPANELKVAVSSRNMARGSLKILATTPVKIPAGGSAPVQVGFPIGRFAENLHFELSEPPEGIMIKKVSLVRDGAEILLQSDAGKIKPGLEGNLLVNVFATRAQESGKAIPQSNRRRTPLGTLPAIPFEIVEQ